MDVKNIMLQSNTMKKILITYHIQPCELDQDLIWRNELLGPESGYWAGRTDYGQVYSITIAVSPEMASFISLSKTLQPTPKGWSNALNSLTNEQ